MCNLQTSFFKHRATKIKNLERVAQLGNEVHKFDRYKSHVVKHSSPYRYLDKFYYEPPEYMRRDPCQVYKANFTLSFEERQEYVFFDGFVRQLFSLGKKTIVG